MFHSAIQIWEFFLFHNYVGIWEYDRTSYGIWMNMEIEIWPIFRSDCHASLIELRLFEQKGEWDCGAGGRGCIQ